MNIAVISSIILIGFTAMASQIVLVRELLIVFCGNELSLAFILASWLVGGAMGSIFSGSFSDRLKRRETAFVSCQVALAAFFPITIAGVRLVRLALGVNPGQIVPVFPAALASFIILLPICMILGAMFSLAARIHLPELNRGAFRIGEVYLLEAVGAMAGGVIASFILIRYLSSMQIMGLLGLLMSSAAVMMLRRQDRKDRNRGLFAVSALIFLLYTALWLFGGWRSLDAYLDKVKWSGYTLLGSRNSVFDNIAVTRKGSQISFFDNGLHLYTVPDKATAEESVHFALLEHPDPRAVLLIGGGAGGLLGEIEKHPVDRIDYVELDPLIIAMAKEYLPAAEARHLSDPRVSLILEDGRRYVKRTSAKYDVVIVNIGDPYTAQLNRYYTLEFYGEVRRIMKSPGVLSFGLGASESYIGREQADFLRSIFLTLGREFDDIRIIPGETAYFLASKEKGLLTYDYNILMERARSRALELEYVREYYLSSRMSGKLVAYTEGIVSDSRKIRINRDFRPSSYYYAMISWAARFKDSLLVKAMKAVDEKLIWIAAAVIVIAIFVSGFRDIALKKVFARVAMLSVLANGFSQMAFQVIVLLAFQMIYGFMFYKLGIILTAFMAGAALGSRFGLSLLERIDTRGRKYVLVALQGCLCLYPAILSSVLVYMSGPRGPVAGWIGSNIIFLALPVFSGFLGGTIFPVAGAICLNREEDRGATAGSNYGRDLLGSCAGALLVGAFLVPILGIPNTCLWIAALNFKVFLVLIAGAVLL